VRILFNAADPVTTGVKYQHDRCKCTNGERTQPRQNLYIYAKICGSVDEQSRTASRRETVRGHLRRANAGIQSLLNIHPAALSHSKLTAGHLNKSTNWFSSVGIPNERGDDRRRRSRNGIYFRLYRSELILLLH
jgi:hypothetical protein